MTNLRKTLDILLIIVAFSGAVFLHVTKEPPVEQPQYTIDKKVGAVTSLEQSLKGKTQAEKRRLKGQEIAKIKSVARQNVKFSNADYDIEIVDTKPFDKGVIIFARAWYPSGEQIGFGEDGTVDIERFIIVNPPVLVDDKNGDIVRTWQEEDIDTGELITKTRTLREDPKQATLESLAHTIKVKQERFDSKKIVRGKIGRTTTTVYPDADPESTTVDGNRVKYDDTSWDNAHDALSASDSGNDNGANNGDGLRVTNRSASPIWIIGRTMAYFDTSSIGATDTINSATASLYVTSTSNGDNDGDDFVSVVQTQGNNIVSDTAVNDGDFDQVGDAIDDPTEGHDAGQRKDITSMSTSAYTDWTLNATGLGWIARSGEQKPAGATAGITYLGYREGHDILDNSVAALATNSVVVSMADETGTTQDPKLVIESTAGAAAEDVNNSQWW